MTYLETGIVQRRTDDRNCLYFRFRWPACSTRDTVFSLSSRLKCFLKMSRSYFSVCVFYWNECNLWTYIIPPIKRMILLPHVEGRCCDDTHTQILEAQRKCFICLQISLALFPTRCAVQFNHGRKKSISYPG